MTNAVFPLAYMVSPGPPLAVSVLSGLLACFFAGRAAWRVICGPPAAPKAVGPPEGVKLEQTPGPARRFLGRRFWLWPLAALLLTVAAIFLPRPGDLSEPGESAQILEPRMYFLPEGGTYRFITWDQTPKFKSVYRVMTATIANQMVTRNIGWDKDGLSFGFFHRKGNWRPVLSPQPMSEDAGKIEPSLVNGVMTWMEQSEIDKVLPLVVAELDKREAGRGARFQEMLRDGVVAGSFICWQNLVVLLAWLSLPLAVLALIWGLREIFVACVGALLFALAVANGTFTWSHYNMDWITVPLTIIAGAGVVILLVLHRRERPAGIRAALPVFTLLVLGAGAGGLPWAMAFVFRVPGWHYWQGAAFSLIYLALALIQLVASGERSTRLRAVSMLGGGIVALTLAIICAAWTPSVHGEINGAPTAFGSSYPLSGLMLAMALAILTAIIGAVQFRQALTAKTGSRTGEVPPA